VITERRQPVEPRVGAPVIINTDDGMSESIGRLDHVPGVPARYTDHKKFVESVDHYVEYSLHKGLVVPHQEMIVANSPWLVPIAAPNRFLPGEHEAVMAAVERVVASPQWVLGEEVEAFEREFAAFIGAQHVVGVGNGTDALVLAMLALDLPAFADVIVVADDGGFGALAASLLGLRPVVADVDSGCGVATVNTLSAACTSATAAVIVTHLHGNLVPLAEIDAWRRQRGLILIEDCAQAHGLRSESGHVGSTGDLATFSFYPTKNLGAIGDAGAVAVPHGPESTDIDERLRRLREYGWGARYRVDFPGGRNSRMDEIQAAVLRARLPFVDERTSRRLMLRDSWQQAIAGVAYVSGVDSQSVAHHLVINAPTVDSRQRLAEVLGLAGVAVAVHYPWLVHEMPGVGAVAGATPTAAARRDRMLSVPAEPMLNESEIACVAAALRTWSQSKR